MKYLRRILVICIVVIAGIALYRYFYERSILETIITRLKADSRVAEVLVTSVNYNESSTQNLTTIKFLEYDVKGDPLEPKYFSFPGNVIQFQSLVVRFDDRFVMAGDRLRGKSVYLFLKVFMLDGKNTKEFPISIYQQTPQGYRIKKTGNSVEDRFWREFWMYAFDKHASEHAGIKNVQIEAPGAMFIPGYLYTIKIEHNGGLRIDTKPLPAIVRGEKVL